MPFWVSVIRGVPGNSESPWSLWVASATGDSLCRCEGLCQGGVSVFMGFLSWVPLHPLSFWVFRVTTEAPLVMGVFLCHARGWWWWGSLCS